MESLASYASDDESNEFSDVFKIQNNHRSQEEDANYDDIGMDESSEESNNNLPDSDRHDRHVRDRLATDDGAEVTQDRIAHDASRSAEDADRPSGWQQEEVVVRRHSSDMEMDDGEDDLDNYSLTTDTATKVQSPPEHKPYPKKSTEDEHKRPSIEKRSTSDVRQKYDERTESSSSCKSRDERKDWDKPKEERSREHKKEKGRSLNRRNSDERRSNDRRKSPERRKRSHSPDRRDRERDRDKERRGARRSSRSPERSWKSRKLEKKAAVLTKLGIELKADVGPNMGLRGFLGDHLKSQIQEVEARTGITLPTYYNPGVMNPLKYAQQIQKRKLLWGNKSTDQKQEVSQAPTPNPTAVKQWEGTTFKGDNDGKMTEKFKRLMGIKSDGPAQPSSVGAPKGEIIQKQEEMFSNMEAQYQVARMATHTHRGVGLGFGTFQVTPR